MSRVSKLFEEAGGEGDEEGQQGKNGDGWNSVEAMGMRSGTAVVVTELSACI